MKRTFGAVTVALVAGAAMFVSIPSAGAVAISPTCEVFGIDGSGNATGAALFSGVALPPINVPDLGGGNVVAGTTFPVHADGTSTSLPDGVTQPIPASISEIKNIKLTFKITGAAAVSSASVSGGNVLGASATTSTTSLVLNLPGSQNGSTVAGGNAFFPGGGSLNTPAIDLNVTAPASPGTIKTELTGISLVAKTSLLTVALLCEAPANTVGEVNVTRPGAPVAVDDAASTPVGEPATIDVLANDEPNDAGSPPQPETLEIVTAPKHGTAEVTDDFKVLYTPEAGFQGTDTFVYEVCADNGQQELVCDPGTVVIAVGDDVQPQATTTTAPSTTTTVAAQAELPRTGRSSAPLGALGIVLVGSGSLAVAAGRRFGWLHSR